ncbi:hypothetical protein PV325_003453 [Microctonus aethiopoides]|nr:hypothetical protein PV325_003453 [Microctonus aethiopoides]
MNHMELRTINSRRYLWSLDLKIGNDVASVMLGEFDNLKEVLFALFLSGNMSRRYPGPLHVPRKKENEILQVTESKLIVEDICNCLEGKPKRVTKAKNVQKS